MKFLFFSFLFMIFSFSVIAQNSRDVDQSNAYEPYKPEENVKAKKKQLKKKQKKSFRTIFNKNMDKKVDEFWDRMELNARQKRRLAKKMEKPQYSDPSYFGHKKKPKKRPVGKRKFCKECHIVH